MRKLIVLCLILALCLFGGIHLSAKTGNPSAAAPAKKDAAKKTDRIDLKTKTLVSKKLDRVEETPKGKVHHYLYRVEAEPTETDLPRYNVDPQYNVRYEQEGFQEGDSVTLVSENTESATDSPVWVYDVAYTGAGTRQLTFETAGSVMPLALMSANSETDPDDPNYHCRTCGHYDISQCTAACRCCCSTGDENCNCLGCQYQNPRCFECPVGCTCEHCVCSCDGCLQQNPRCLVCPVGCTCEHCQCLCSQNIDHEGRCGCAFCKQRPLQCDCECHCVCP